MKFLKGYKIDVENTNKITMIRRIKSGGNGDFNRKMKVK